MNTKKIAVVMGAVALIAGAAAAQEGGRGGGMGPLGGRGFGPGGPGFFGRGDGVGRFEVPREILDIVAEATGLEPAALRAQLMDGQTLAALITANDASVEEVSAQILQTLTDAINERVTNGRLTQERADALIAALPEQIDSILNAENPVRTFLVERTGPRDALLDAIETTTGLERADIRAALAEGKSLSDLLADAGVTVEAFVDEVLAPVQERLAEQVSSGVISQAVADARLNLYRVELIDRLNKAQADQE
jgi:hypothetical protein